jgi:carotenoid cleavage dioxygenase-like enzyme
MLGAYEENSTGLLHVDLLKYKDASAYTVHTFVENAIDGQEYPDDLVQVTRYSINMTTWELKEEIDLVKDKTIKNTFEFPNINQAYQGKPYKYAYMMKNIFKTNGSVVKLNVDAGSLIEDIMPTGMFPTEPYFIPTPNSKNEDDGVVLVSGIDGERKRGFIRVYNATNMDLIAHGTAPKLTLFGVHSRFYPFDIGCEEEDCTPKEDDSTTMKTTTPEENDSNMASPSPFALPLALIIYYLRYLHHE